MKREIFLHFSFWFSFFVFCVLVNGLYSLNLSEALRFAPFWLGGIFGTLLPDIDHLLYLYLHSQEYVSQRAGFMFDKREIGRTFQFLYETRGERKNLIFHTFYFQIIFLVLTFWVVTSSNSLFGKGLVLAFSLHLLIDQIVDLMEMESFDNWTKNSPFNLDINRAKLYWLSALILLCIIGILL